MKKSILFLILLLTVILISCKGHEIAEGVFRPKHPKFSITKKPFQSNPLINYQKMYISTKEFHNYDGDIIIGYMGFYSDGRMIIDATSKNKMDQTMEERNSFSTTGYNGYYTTNGNNIKLQYFITMDGGQYRIREGIIKQDTIVLIEKVVDLFRIERRYETFVVSPYSLKE